MPRLNKVLGFSLIELVTIIVIIGALAFFALPRLQLTDTSLLTSRDIIVTALSHAQQVAMARDSASNPITVELTVNAIDVRESGASVSLPAVTYPMMLPSGIAVTAGTGTFDYDKLGQTAATSIVLNGGQASITVEASGYAH